MITLAVEDQEVRDPDQREQGQPVGYHADQADQEHQCQHGQRRQDPRRMVDR